MTNAGAALAARAGVRHGQAVESRQSRDDRSGAPGQAVPEDRAGAGAGRAGAG